jgi:hypothetical protein
MLQVIATTPCSTELFEFKAVGMFPDLTGGGGYN